MRKTNLRKWIPTSVGCIGATFIYVAQVDHIGLFRGETGRQQAVVIQWAAALQIQRLDPVARETIDDVDVRLRVDQEMAVVVYCTGVARNTRPSLSFSHVQIPSQHMRSHTQCPESPCSFTK